MNTNKYDFKYYIVRSQRLAGYLMQRGFKLISIKQDEAGNGRNIFFFNNSFMLRDAIEQYKEYKDILIYNYQIGKGD